MLFKCLCCDELITKAPVSGEGLMLMFKCLCCDQLITKRGQPISPERAAKSYAVLTAMGYTRESLVNEHRANLEFTSPGFVEWLEQQHG